MLFSLLGRFTISVLVKLYGLFLILALLTLGLFTAYNISSNRVGGPTFNAIMDGRNLAVDLVPPALNPAEAFALANIAARDPAKAEVIAARIEVLKTEFNDRLQHWDGKLNPAVGLQDDAWMAASARLRELGDQFWTRMDTSFLPAARKGDAFAMNAAIVSMVPAYRQLGEIASARAVASSKTEAALEEQGIQAGWFGQIANIVMNGGLALVVIAMVIIGQIHIIKPLTNATAAMTALAEGKYDVAISSNGRRDEIGHLADAMTVFRAQALENERNRELTARRGAAEKAEDERKHAEAEAVSQERARVMEHLGEGLSRLAQRDLTFRIQGLPSSYGRLEENFNAAVAQLETIIASVSANISTIDHETRGISETAADLSRRGESQAANVIETVNAVSGITLNVTRTAESAVKAKEAVDAAERDALGSGETVGKAIEAMKRIEKSSEEISTIIGVVEEMSFQTNLLSLNAGVEAARAGESGRGFAVVAQEVRALAQRSANSAKDIKALVAEARAQVKEGAGLVSETGAALERILERVTDLNAMVADVAGSAESQAAALQQVNAAVGDMDDVAQKNAAMIEQASAATRLLASQAAELNVAISTFVTAAQRNSGNVRSTRRNAA